MILSTNQPYFFPFPDFFHKAYLSNVFVILDDTQFPRGTTWINRNRFKNDQGTLWLTVPVYKKGLGFQKINQVKIFHEGRWVKKHLESLKTAYAKAPYFADHYGFVEKVYSSKVERLIDLNLMIIRYLMKQLQINTEILLLSELGIKANGSRLLIEICRALGASTFLTQRAAVKYLDKALFHAAGILLNAFTTRSPVYPQLWGDFLPNLSALDLLMNCGPKARDVMIGR